MILNGGRPELLQNQRQLNLVLVPRLDPALTVRANLQVDNHRLVFTVPINPELKIPWRNGTTHVLFEPLDFMYRMYGMPRAQEAQERPSPGWLHWYPSQELISSAFMEYSRRIVIIGHLSHLQSEAGEIRSRLQKKHETKLLPRKGLQ